MLVSSKVGFGKKEVEIRNFGYDLLLPRCFFWRFHIAHIHIPFRDLGVQNTSIRLRTAIGMKDFRRITSIEAILSIQWQRIQIPHSMYHLWRHHNQSTQTTNYMPTPELQQIILCLPDSTEAPIRGINSLISLVLPIHSPRIRELFLHMIQEMLEAIAVDMDTMRPIDSPVNQPERWIYAGRAVHGQESMWPVLVRQVEQIAEIPMPLGTQKCLVSSKMSEFRRGWLTLPRGSTHKIRSFMSSTNFCLLIWL